MSPRQITHSTFILLSALALAACTSVSLDPPAPVVDRSTQRDGGGRAPAPTPAPVETRDGSAYAAPSSTPSPNQPAPVDNRSTPSAVSSTSLPSMSVPSGASNPSVSPAPAASTPPAPREKTYPYSTDGSFQGEMVGHPAPGSAFSKVKIGHEFQYVQGVIGAPQKVYTQQTGKAWIPFYYGNDASRIIGLYPGEGCLTFTGGNKLGWGSNELIRIEVDPSGSCYRP